jgi:predicted transglutaminase-like cysteine proteinase
MLRQKCLSFIVLAIAFCMLLVTTSHSKITFSSELFSKIRDQFGEDALKRVEGWQEVLQQAQSDDVAEQLKRVNDFFNKLDFVDDKTHWGKKDYWATPLEFLTTNAGDCEDFTIAKYFSLVDLGVEKSKLRLMYVTATRPPQAHMVLAYYETPDSIPLVLDNLNKRILPASQRRDLVPIYSFNGDGLWLAKAQGRGRQMQKGSNNELWSDLNERIESGN